MPELVLGIGYIVHRTLRLSTLVKSRIILLKHSTSSGDYVALYHVDNATDRVSTEYLDLSTFVPFERVTVSLPPIILYKRKTGMGLVRHSFAPGKPHPPPKHRNDTTAKDG